MQYVLSPRALATLRRSVSPNALLAFDFDGTLAPIVADPDRARMRSLTRGLLRDLTRRRTCIVLSGRSRADLVDKLRGAGIRHLIGNHGAEPFRGALLQQRSIVQWERELIRELTGLAGVWIENKGLSLTVHYRLCLDKERTLAGIARAAKGLEGVRLVPGKECVSIVSTTAPHKGTVLKTLMARYGVRFALYVGDDDTDEDAFAIDHSLLRVFTVRVGRKAGSRASYYLRAQEEIDDLLRQLLKATV